MFAFECLDVYQKVKIFNKAILDLLDKIELKHYVKDQLARAALSIRLNIAEGSSRVTKRDKSRFLVIARGSAFECASLLDFLNEDGLITEIEFQEFYLNPEEISKMLFALIKKLKQERE